MAVVVAGEALIDLVEGDGDYRPITGGSPYNVAIGLCRLETPTGFLSRLSTDRFGRILESTLRTEGADLSQVAHTNDPTTLAIVHTDPGGEASYEFYLKGTSATGMSATELPELPRGATLHVSLGAIALDTPSTGPALRALLTRERGRRIVSFDPNIRPSAIGDLTAYAARLEASVTEVDVIRVSEDDLRLLNPRRDPLDIASTWASRTAARRSPGMVVLTRGAQGAVALRGQDRVEVAAEQVEVVDTVGAGDAFTAGFLHWIDAHGFSTGTKDLEHLRSEDFARALRYASHVAAVTCTRTGADPPRRDEL